MVVYFDASEGYDFAGKRFFEMCGDTERVKEDGKKAFEYVKNQISMRAVYREVSADAADGKITVDGVKISCPVLTDVRGIKKVYLYALTAGDIKYDEGVLHSVLADAWGTAFNDACCMLLKKKIQAENYDLFVSDPFGPGFYGIDTYEIENIFKVIDYKGIGLGLQGRLITPIKSSTGFFVVSDREMDFSDCKRCAGDRNCVYCRNYNGSVSVKFADENRIANVKAGTTVLAAANAAGIAVETPCGGMGKCGKCMVDISDARGTRTVRACTEHITADCEVFTRAGNDEMSVSIVSNERGSEYNLAADIGTTTIEISILCGGNEVCRISSTNPQTAYSQDIMGRINFPKHDILTAAITDRINAMINAASKRLDISNNDITFMAASGNTVMQYLVLGEDPKPLGRYPYSVGINRSCECEAKALGININGKVRFMPYISAFVGGDAAAGILSERLWEKENTLLIDIGTNAEIAIYRNYTLYVTSAAAGPAFEGMSITFGMRARDGAISSFKIINNAVSVSTIGSAKARGICGSGLPEIISELIRIGAIQNDGSFTDKRVFLSPLRPRMCEYNGEAAFRVCNDVYLTQSDIRHFQLAKSAIRAGVELMSDGADAIIISGALGEHISENALIKTGLLPGRFAGKITAAGNTSLKGAKIMCADRSAKDRILKAAKNAITVNLAEKEEFKKLFIEHMNFGDD